MLSFQSHQINGTRLLNAVKTLLWKIAWSHIVLDLPSDQFLQVKVTHAFKMSLLEILLWRGHWKGFTSSQIQETSEMALFLESPSKTLWSTSQFGGLSISALSSSTNQMGVVILDAHFSIQSWKSVQLTLKWQCQISL